MFNTMLGGREQAGVRGGSWSWKMGVSWSEGRWSELEQAGAAGARERAGVSWSEGSELGVRGSEGPVLAYLKW